MEPYAVEDKEGLILVGFQGRIVTGLSPASNAPEVVPRLWEALFGRLDELTQRKGDALYGWVRSDPEDETKEVLRYVAAARVSADASVPEGMTRVEVPAGTFAVFTFRGPMRGFLPYLRRIYGEWLPASGLTLAPGADVECYDERFRADRDDSEMEYWVPVTRAESSS